MTDPATEPLWKQAFPDYGGLDFELPEGFEDASWRNEACPGFMNAELDVHLYADYRDPAQREHPDAKRFTLLETIDGQYASSPVVLAGSDNFEDILTAIQERRDARGPKLA